MGKASRDFMPISWGYFGHGVKLTVLLAFGYGYAIIQNCCFDDEQE